MNLDKMFAVTGWLSAAFLFLSLFLERGNVRFVILTVLFVSKYSSRRRSMLGDNSDT
jgi:hypothetical protein